MARFLFIFSLLIGSTLASAQKMYSCNQAYEADLKVFVVNQKYEADLCVYRAAQKYEAVENKGFWFFTECICWLFKIFNFSSIFKRLFVINKHFVIKPNLLGNLKLPKGSKIRFCKSTYPLIH